MATFITETEMTKPRKPFKVEMFSNFTHALAVNVDRVSSGPFFSNTESVSDTELSGIH